MSAIKKLGGNDLKFFGYGGQWMQKEGFDQTFDFNIDNLMDKTFHSYRKSKTNHISNHYKWTPFNLVNKHYTRNADQVFDNMSDADIVKRIYQSRPSLVLNIGNEYLTMRLMDELRSKYRSID